MVYLFKLNIMYICNYAVNNRMDYAKNALIIHHRFESEIEVVVVLTKTTNT